MLGGSMLSNGTILLITANMRKDLPMECSSQKLATSVGETAQMNETQCVLIDVYNQSVNATRPCTWLQKGTKFKSTVCETITVGWIRAGILVICTPYTFVFLKSFLEFCKKCQPALIRLMLKLHWRKSACLLASVSCKVKS